MLEHLMALLAGFVIAVIAHLRYGGIVLLLAIESACIPLPSEVILPFSGYLVYRGELNLWLVTLAGAIGCVIGSWVAYAVAAWGGRPLVERYGKYLLVSHHDLDLADRWFRKYGDLTIFIGRLLPVVRTFIAFPAGVARMRLWRFTLYTFLGSLIWCWALAWIGIRLGEHWNTLGGWFHRFDIVIVAAFVVFAIWYVRRHIRQLRRPRSGVAQDTQQADGEQHAAADAGNAVHADGDDRQSRRDQAQ